MLDIGWTELMVIGVLALLVVGPKELPRLLRTVGQFVAKARGMAREFQRSMEDAAREADLSELTDLKRDIDKMGRVSFKDQAKRSSASLKTPAKTPAKAAEPEAVPVAGAAEESTAGGSPASAAPAGEKAAAKAKAAPKAGASGNRPGQASAKAKPAAKTRPAAKAESSSEADRAATPAPPSERKTASGK